MRAAEPVCRARLSRRLEVWLVTRYADVAALLRDPRFVKDAPRLAAAGGRPRAPWAPKFLRPLTQNMLDLDEPAHTRLRRLVQRAFTTARVDGMRGRVEDLADRLLDGPAARGGMDLVAELAVPLPVAVITEMLGIPARRPAPLPSLDEGDPATADSRRDDPRPAVDRRLPALPAPALRAPP